METFVTLNHVLSVLSFVEATRYMLKNGCAFVRPRKLCQDPLEEYFGRHRTMCPRNINPNLYSFGYVIFHFVVLNLAKA